MPRSVVPGAASKTIDGSAAPTGFLLGSMLLDQSCGHARLAFTASASLHLAQFTVSALRRSCASLS
jgi:hypothetical protein